jgi:hypothetical protein
MKLLQTFKKMRGLNSRGISHLVLPLAIVMLVGVTGTYMLVGSKAATNKTGGFSADSASKIEKPGKKKGYLLVYSQKGRYEQVSIRIAGAHDPNTYKTHKCGGSFNNSNHSVHKKFKSSGKKFPPLKITCSAVGESALYEVYFGKNNKFIEDYTAVDVDEGYCTHVFRDASLVKKSPVDKNTGTCQHLPDPVTKYDLDMRVLPQLTKNKKALKGFVELALREHADPTDPMKITGLNKHECVGEIHVTIGGSSEELDYDLPIKFVKGKKGGYCIASLNQRFTGGGKLLSPGVTTVKADFSGSVYFNPSTSTANITIPKN